MNEAARTIHALAERIETLTPPERLRLAAALMEERQGELAYAIAHKVVDELGLAIGLCRTPIAAVAP